MTPPDQTPPSAREDVAVIQGDDCPYCGGIGELEATLRDGKRDYVPCPHPCHRQLDEERGRGSPDACSVCGGDCSSANPPVTFCPMRDATPPAGRAGEVETAIDTIALWREEDRFEGDDFPTDAFDILIGAARLAALPSTPPAADAGEKKWRLIGRALVTRMATACDWTKAGKDHVKVRIADWHVFMEIAEQSRAALRDHGEAGA